MVSGIHANGFAKGHKHTMALDQSAFLEVLEALKAAEVDDEIRLAAETIYQALIDAELSSVIGAFPDQRTEMRTGQRNGYRPRTLSTTAGDLELKIPRLRAGWFFPSLLERRRRVDQSLFALIMEAYLHGTSVDDLVKALGADTGISKSEVRGSAPIWIPRSPRSATAV
jgi:putative transposase